jgi:hypothetical protein
MVVVVMVVQGHAFAAFWLPGVWDCGIGQRAVKVV